MKFKHLTAIAFITLSMASCIDQSWDLSKIKNDEILLFTDGVTLPAGNFETIRFDKKQLDKLLPDMKENLVQRGNQIYIEYHTDTNKITTDEMKSSIFDDIKFGSAKPVIYNLGKQAGTIPSGRFPMTKKEVKAIDPSVKIGENIKRLDLVTLKNANLKISISQIGLKSTNPDDKLEFEVKIPKDIVLDDTPFDDITISNDTVFFNIPFSKIADSKTAIVEIPIKEINDPLSIDPFYVNGYIISKGIPYVANSKINLLMVPVIEEQNIDRIEGKFSFEFNEIEMPVENKILEQLYDAFGEEAVIDFYAPQLVLKTNSSFTTASIMNLSMNYQTKNGEMMSESVIVDVKASPTNNLTQETYLLGTRIENNPQDGTYTLDLTKVLKEGRRNLNITATVKLDESEDKQILYSNMEAMINAVFETPFIFGKDLKADINEQKEEVFDQKTIDLLFSAENSEVYIDAEVSKEIPLNIQLSIDVLNDKNESIGVQIADVMLTEEKTQKIQFIVSKEDAPKMINARNLLIKGYVFTGDELAGKIITVEDYVDIKNMKIRKKGGVIIKP